MSGSGCFNDPDMLIVGMYGKGNVGMDVTPYEDIYAPDTLIDSLYVINIHPTSLWMALSTKPPCSSKMHRIEFLEMFDVSDIFL